MADKADNFQDHSLTPKKKLFFSLILIGFFLLALELLSYAILAFLYLPVPIPMGSDAYMAPDPRLGWVLAPGVSHHIVEPPKGFDMTVHTGAGFRMDAQNIRHVKDCDIITIGDSHTFGYGLKDDQTLAFQLHSLLSDDHRACLVFNGGVPSYGLDQYFLRLRSLGRLARGSLVIVYIDPINDIRNLSRDIDYVNPRPYARLAKSGVRYVRPILYKPKRDFHFAPDFDSLNQAFRVSAPPPPPVGVKLFHKSKTWQLLSGLRGKRYRFKWTRLEPTEAIGPYQDGGEYEKAFQKRIEHEPLQFAASQWSEISEFASERRVAEELIFGILRDMKRHVANQRASLLVVIAEEAYGKQGYFIRARDTLRQQLPQYHFEGDWSRQAVKRAAEKAQIPFLMMEYPMDRIESMFVPYDGHTSAEGFSLTARRIAEWMEKQHFAFLAGRGPIQAPVQEESDINSLDGNGYTLLHYAIQNGSSQAVDRLISEGADVNLTDMWGETPAYIAASRGHTGLLRMLIDKGANINAADHRGQSPLHQAVSNRDKDTVKLLMANAVDVNAKNKAGRTALDIALRQKRIKQDIVDLLRSKGGTGDISIHRAAQWGDAEKARALLDGGSDVNSKDPNGRTPLHLAAGNKQKDMAAWLISKGADLNAEDGKGATPLDSAIQSNDANMVKLLLDHGARFDVEGPDGWTAFRASASQGSRDFVDLMIAKGGDVSSLPLAACAGKLARVQELVKQGADVNAQDKLGWTPLYWAVSLDRTEVAGFLMDQGADVRKRTSDGGTALHQAARAGDRALVELMLTKGADVNAKMKRWITALHSAASAGHSEMVALLIAKGADIDAKTTNGLTPLHMAAMAGHKEVVEVLVAKGADVNAKQKNGQTPLHLAVQQGRRDMTELLLRKGADVNARNKRNRTPLDIAVARVDSELVELLRRPRTPASSAAPLK